MASRFASVLVVVACVVVGSQALTPQAAAAWHDELLVDFNSRKTPMEAMEAVLTRVTDKSEIEYTDGDVTHRGKGKAFWKSVLSPRYEQMESVAIARDSDFFFLSDFRTVGHLQIYVAKGTQLPCPATWYMLRLMRLTDEDKPTIESMKSVIMTSKTEMIDQALCKYSFEKPSATETETAMKKLQMSRMGKFFDALHFNITSPETFVPEFFAADAVTHTYWSSAPIKGHAEHIAFYKKYAEHKDTRRFASAPTLLLVGSDLKTVVHKQAFHLMKPDKSLSIENHLVVTTFDDAGKISQMWALGKPQKGAGSTYHDEL